MPPEVAAALDARPVVERMLARAIQSRASDLHVEPTNLGYELRLRIDGILGAQETLEPAIGRAVVSRLMVMARLLTYRLDIPQEGRISISLPVGAADVELRLAIMPTIHGLRASLRMPADRLQAAVLAELNLPDSVRAGIESFAAADSGMFVFTGPAGSGKTTTIYALLRHLLTQSPGAAIVALEDPVERDLPGVTQIEVSPFGQLTYERALRSMLRQDPQVLMLGEIRDAATASLAVQAALSGHRLITTLHAASAGGAITRLLEMGIERYQVTSSLWGIASQRLARRRVADGMYRGRIPIAELVRMDAALRQAVLNRADADEMQRIYSKQVGFRSLADVAADWVAAGLTDAAEVSRALGCVSM